MAEEWEREEAEIEAARQEAAAALPTGWELGRSDNERYNTPGLKLDTASAAASGPGGEVVMAIALSEAAAWRLLARRLRGEVQESDGWIPPIPTR